VAVGSVAASDLRDWPNANSYKIKAQMTSWLSFILTRPGCVLTVFLRSRPLEVPGLDTDAVQNTIDVEPCYLTPKRSSSRTSRLSISTTLPINKSNLVSNRSDSLSSRVPQWMNKVVLPKIPIKGMATKI
jgi:hypothetical protein